MICLNCGKEYETSKARRGFCSHHCWYESTKVKRICEKCGKEFMAAQSVVCKDCQVTKRSCLQCGKEFRTYGHNSKFCSRECYLKYNLIHIRKYRDYYRRKNPYKCKVFIEKECEVCGKVFMPKASHHVCCSQRCRNKRLYKRRYGLKPKNANHKWLLDKKLCECCGYDKKPALHAHHLSKKKMDVVVLCANCHYIFHSLIKIELVFSYTKEQVLKIIQDFINK